MQSVFEEYVEQLADIACESPLLVSKENIDCWSLTDNIPADPAFQRAEDNVNRNVNTSVTWPKREATHHTSYIYKRFEIVSF